MANRYWVGDGGNWIGGDTTHWSETSGGTPGATVPSSSDDVFFDENSFSSDGQTILVSTSVNYINNFDASAMTHTCTFVGDFLLATMISALGPTVTLSDKLTLTGSGSTKDFQIRCLTGASLTTNNATIDVRLSFGVTVPSAGIYTIQDDIVSTKGILVQSGTLDANDNDITAESFWANDGADGITLMGSGTWTITGASTGFMVTGVNDIPTINAETSTLYASKIDSPNLDLTFYNLRAYGNALNMGSAQNITCTNATFTSGQTITFKSGATFTTSTLVANGSPGSLITFTTSTATVITLSAASTSLSYLSVRRNTASGLAIPFHNFPGGVDLGTNTNWCFTVACSPILANYNSSLISAVQRVQQNNEFPQFVIGGRNASEYQLFKKTTTNEYSLWRSPVYKIGTDFNVSKITLPLITDMTSSTTIKPALYFDDESSSVLGTVINNTNYSNTNKLIELTPANFGNKVHGKDNFFFELQFTGTALSVVGLPIFIDVEVME